MSVHRPRRRTPFLTVIAVLLGGFAVPLLAPATANAACPTVQSGSRGSCVLTLQKRLVALHYDLGKPDGAFGPQTQHAVIAFQKVNGLKRTGVVGAGTWWRLYHQTVIPHLRYVRSGSALEVNLTRQVLYRASGGALVRIYDVSTGRPSLPTPTSGSRPFAIWKKAYSGGTGYGDLEHYVQYFYRGTLLAIHAYGYVPNYPASHGCIRMVPQSAQRLYAATYLGERVFTYN